MIRIILSVVILTISTTLYAGDIDRKLTGEELQNQIKKRQTLMKNIHIAAFHLIHNDSLEITPEPTQQQTLQGEVLHNFRGKDVPLPYAKIGLLDKNGMIAGFVRETTTNKEGEWKISVENLKAGTYTVIVSLTTPNWIITNSTLPYAIQIGEYEHAQGGGKFPQAIIGLNHPLNPATSIHHVAALGKDFFDTQNIETTWWKQLRIIWPADGDYYFSKSVNLTDGKQWDVAGHEIGHAIYDLGTQGVLAGGQHYIDQCYTPTLAFSEGWASFYSAITQIQSNDPNAQFEFMVARRAPLGIEHVPADVCNGANNEWRVYAALWDLYDSYETDDDNFVMPFLTQWQAMQGPYPVSSLQLYITRNLFPLTESEETNNEILRVMDFNTIRF